MITLNIYKDNVRDDNGDLYPIYNIQIFDRISVVLGDSGTGKTYLFDAINHALNGEDPWTYNCFNNLDTSIKIDVYTVNSIAIFNNIIKNTTGALIIIDEDTTENIRKNNLVRTMQKSKNYFLLLDRQMVSKIDVNIKSMFVVEECRYKKHKTFKVKNAIEMHTVDVNTKDISNIKYMITEDTKSGKVFWEKTLSKIQLLEFKEYGNGSIAKNIEEALNKIDGILLVALDYDKGGIQMQHICNSKNIDLSRVLFISMESFEELVCNSEFILKKYTMLRNLVRDYKLYITCDVDSTGKYFSTLLFKYVKAKPPIQPRNGKNITKFYKKEASYFEECFIDDCCAYGNTQCEMYYTGNKKESMLSNKFEIYRVFI